MGRQPGSATIPSRKQIFTFLTATLIAALAMLPQGSARAEWEATLPDPAAPSQGIFGSRALQSRGLEMASQWNRVLDRLPKLSEALSACAANAVHCTAPWMGAWLQVRRAAADLEHSFPGPGGAPPDPRAPQIARVRHKPFLYPPHG